MDKEDLPSDSDESDVDYNPSGEDSNLPSEVESDGDAEEPVDAEGDEPAGKGKRKRKQKKGGKKRKKPIVEEEEVDEEEGEEQKALTAEEEKKKTDSLWSDFLSDTKVTKPAAKQPPATPAPTIPIATATAATPTPTPAPPEKKVVVTQIFEFAGEEVRVTKEVAADSPEARLHAGGPSSSRGGRGGRGGGGGRGSPSGMAALLGRLGRKDKLGTLDKSKLDWDRFKQAEGIGDEISTHNRGKQGYLEQQDFLQRADARQFEIEKDLRTSTRRSNR